MAAADLAFAEQQRAVHPASGPQRRQMRPLGLPAVEEALAGPELQPGVTAELAVQGAEEVIAMPVKKEVSAVKAEDVSKVYDKFAFTLAANVAGLPAVSLPGFVTTAGEDLGLQFIGLRLTDSALLDCTAKLMSTQTGGL